MFDSPEGRAVSKAPINDCVNGQEVSYRGRVEFSILGEERKS